VRLRYRGNLIAVQRARQSRASSRCFDAALAPISAGNPIPRMLRSDERRSSFVSSRRVAAIALADRRRRRRRRRGNRSGIALIRRSARFASRFIFQSRFIAIAIRAERKRGADIQEHDR